MEHKPEPSSLDSDSGEEEDEEEWIDPNEKQDSAFSLSVCTS